MALGWIEWRRRTESTRLIEMCSHDDCEDRRATRRPHRSTERSPPGQIIVRGGPGCVAQRCGCVQPCSAVSRSGATTNSSRSPVASSARSTIRVAQISRNTRSER